MMRRLVLLALIPLALVLASCAGTTSDATNVVSGSASFNASGTCQNSCLVHFRYHQVSPGPVQAWQNTPSVPIGSTNGKTLPFSQSVGGLVAGATYHYQICGSDTGVNADTCGGPDGQDSTYTRFVTPRFATYNIAHFTLGSLSAIADDIRASGATIVALQEATQVQGESTSRAAQLADMLGWNVDGKTHSYYQGWSDSVAGCGPGKTCQSIGNAIISALPIASSGVVPLEPNNQGTARNLIRATITLGPDRSLPVYATWIATDAAGVQYQRDQLHFAVNHIGSLSQVVLMGDFNLPLSADNLSHSFDTLTAQGYHDWKVDRVGGQLSNVCGATNANGAILPCTFSNTDPAHQLQAKGDKRDYIWVKGFPLTAGAVVNNCSTGTCHSDHRPYWTDFGAP